MSAFAYGKQQMSVHKQASERMSFIDINHQHKTDSFLIPHRSAGSSLQLGPILVFKFHRKNSLLKNPITSVASPDANTNTNLPLKKIVGNKT